MKSLVLRTFDNYFSAHILKTRLEDAGITCYLFDEHTSTINPILSHAIGSIKLVVPERDADKAQAFLIIFDQEILENSVCPKCFEGTFISVPKQSAANKIAAMLSWLFSSYAVSATNVYKCRQCGYETETLPDNPPTNN